MSEARKRLDWEEMFKLSMDPEEARRYRAEAKPEKEDFDIVIKTSDIKNHPTILMMEEFVKTAGKESKREVQESYPLTNTQEVIFIECIANMGSTIYNIPYLLKLDNKVDLDRHDERMLYSSL